MAGETRTRLAGTGPVPAVERIEREIQGERRAGRIADDVDRLLADFLREMLGRQLHGGGHVLPADIEQARRRGAVTREAQADHPVVAPVQFLAQRPQAVRRVRHPVQQQYPADRCGGGQFEAAVPVGFANLRVAGTALAVAHECRAGTGLGARIHFRLELREQPVFQPQVVLEGADLVSLGRPILLRQHLGVPRLEGLAAAAGRETTAPARTQSARHPRCSSRCWAEGAMRLMCIPAVGRFRIGEIAPDRRRRWRITVPAADISVTSPGRIRKLRLMVFCRWRAFFATAASRFRSCNAGPAKTTMLPPHPTVTGMTGSPNTWRILST